MSEHLPINPENLPRPSGFSHGIRAAEGRLVFIAGETGHRGDMTIADEFVEQFGQACRNVSAVVAAAGGEPDHIVSLTIYVTDVGSYRDALDDVGREYRSVFGKHFPAMALIGVSELVDPSATVEIVGVAVVPS